MKFAVIIDYGPDKTRLKANHPAHRTYLQGFLGNGQLRAAGPFADDAGDLRVLEVDSAEVADLIVKGDPLVEAGENGRPFIRPLAYWSAQEAKGAS